MKLSKILSLVLMISFKNRFTTSALKHLLFWIGIFCYFLFSSNLKHYYYQGYWQLIESSLFSILLQVITAYTCLYYLVPKFLNTGKLIVFTIYTLVLVFIMFSFYLLYDTYYYNPKYYYLNDVFVDEQLNQSFWERIHIFSAFISRSIQCFTPTALLFTYQFLKKQQRFVKLNEQKKIAELNALKNQLNPHFLFNTLNNLYILAIEKSDKTPDIIERLANILDYIIYRCNDTFVPLKKEIELLKNYIALEKVRYGNRVDVSFKSEITEEVKIAPLVLLTFIENAFKHGVSQELNKAFIDISITCQDNFILFSIKNSKPQYINKKTIAKNAVGLKNVQKQLDLLYPTSHTITIDSTIDFYKVTLKLKQQ